MRATLADLADLHEPAEFTAALAALGRDGAKVLLDPQGHARGDRRRDPRRRRHHRRGRRPGGAAQGAQERRPSSPARAAPTSATARRWCASSPGSTAPAGAATIDEIAAAAKLAEFRADTARRDGSELVDLSFDTISGAGPNGAIVHYRVTPETNRRLEPGSLYLVDSGAQYRDGTTDITRTVAIGTPTAEMRDRFTRVLKGHIAIATARFPVGATGAQLDTLARAALWQAGLDYDHGTGHGVGSFLAVHEGPARISKLGTVPLEPGMILSNEPGYYKTGAYGIRIENLVVVTPAEADRRRRPADARLRDADAGADRPAADRHVADVAGRDRLARRLSRAARPGARPSSRRRRNGAGWRKRTAPVGEIGPFCGNGTRRRISRSPHRARATPSSKRPSFNQRGDSDMKTLLTTTALVALLSAAPALAQSDTAPVDRDRPRRPRKWRRMPA